MNWIVQQIERALAEGNRLRLHQNGFIQLDLLGLENSRLHIWSQGMPKAQDPRTPIHNHTFCFKSTIIVGELTNVEYNWVDADRAVNGDPVCHLYTGSGDYEELVVVPESEGTFYEFNKHTYKPGYTYHFPHGAYHDSWGNGLTATIMTKTNIGCISQATVVVPLGEGGPDNSFRRDQYPQEELMPFVLDVLSGLHELDNRRHV